MVQVLSRNQSMGMRFSLIINGLVRFVRIVQRKLESIAAGI